MSEPIIHCEGMTRRFKKTVAVSALDLSIQPGELFGLVGPDGAGKTTTLRLLAGLLDLNGGKATVAGYNLRRDPEAIKSHIGYMAQMFSLYGELSVLENLVFFADLYDVPRADREGRIERLLAFASLTDFQDRRAVHLSGGMQKKLALACTLIHEPDLLLLDEPTTGVDPVSRREFWNILTELHVTGTTIVVSTPYMDEADRCSMVGFMYAGKIVVCDSPRNIRDSLGVEVIELSTPDWQVAYDLVATLPGVVEVQTYGESLHILVDTASKRIPAVTAALEQNGLKVGQVRQASPRMEAAFVSMIRRMDAETLNRNFSPPTEEAK
jgi:ABC-2 type transport system ATP-binding protein